MTKVNTNGVQANTDALEAVLGRFRQVFHDPVVQGQLFATAGETADLRESFYPPERRGGRRFRFATRKQQRFYWWAVKHGRIIQPYRRTRNLARATTIDVVEPTGRGFTLLIKIDQRIASYAQSVIGRTQLPGHADTGWQKFDVYARRNAPALVRQVGGGLVRAVGNYGLQGRLK
jgi:hypothetical protein